MTARSGSPHRGASRHRPVYPSPTPAPSCQDKPQIVLSALADEAANHKTAVEQFTAFAALGLQYYSIRFIDVGGGVKNVMKLSRSRRSTRSGTCRTSTA